MKPGILVLAAALAIPVSVQAQEAAMDQIGDGVFHFEAFGYSSLVVVGEEGVLVMDTAFTPRAQVMKAEIAKVTDAPVTHVVFSHEHYDHIGGSEVFENAQIVCHDACKYITEMSTFFPMPEIDIEYDYELTIDLGGIEVDLLHPASGDGIATTVAHVPSVGVVFSADMYEPKEFAHPRSPRNSNMLGSQIILNKLLELEPVYAINGHSSGNSLEALKENAELLDKLNVELTRQFREALASGGMQEMFQVALNIDKTLEMEEYADWKNYEGGFGAYARRMALSLLCI